MERNTQVSFLIKMVPPSGQPHLVIAIGHMPKMTRIGWIKNSVSDKMIATKRWRDKELLMTENMFWLHLHAGLNKVPKGGKLRIKLELSQVCLLLARAGEVAVSWECRRCWWLYAGKWVGCGLFAMLKQYKGLEIRLWSWKLTKILVKSGMWCPRVGVQICYKRHKYI